MNQSWVSYKIGICTFIFCLLGFVAIGQTPDLEDINSNRLALNKTNMFILGGWAVTNMVGSGILRSQREGPRKYFHEMNVFWNLVNLGFVGAGLYGSYTTDPSSLGMAETLQAQQNLEKFLMLNIGLNVSYIAAGGWLMERSNTATNKPERLKGYGQSLILQGGFLLLFDTAQLIAHQSSGGAQLKQLLQHVQLSGQGIGLLIQF